MPDPVAKGVRVIGHEWFSLFIELGALIGLTTVILVLLYGQSRIFAAMANDGLLPPVFARVHPTLRTPYISQLVIGGLRRDRRGRGADRCPEPARGRRHALRLHPGLRRGHLPAVGRAQGPSALSRAAVPWVPLLGILSCLGLMAGLAPLTWLRLVGWLAIGLVVYFAYRAIPLAPDGQQVIAP